MSTTNKDFVVKNGLRVFSGVTFGDLTTQNTAYDPTKIVVPSGSSFPASPTNGQLFLKSDNGKLYVYFNNWIEIAYVGGPSGDLFIDGGSPSTVVFSRSFDGGTPTSTFTQIIDGETP